MVIARIDEDDPGKDDKGVRRMFILTGSPDGTFNLAAQSDKVVLAYSHNRNFAEPLEGIEIIRPGTRALWRICHAMDQGKHVQIFAR